MPIRDEGGVLISVGRREGAGKGGEKGRKGRGGGGRGAGEGRGSARREGERERRERRKGKEKKRLLKLILSSPRSGPKIALIDPPPWVYVLVLAKGGGF